MQICATTITRFLISAISTRSPVFITKNGKGDLAVMSIEAYEELTARFELYGALKQGLDDIEAGRVVSAEDAKEMFRKKYPGANI